MPFEIEMIPLSTRNIRFEHNSTRTLLTAYQAQDYAGYMQVSLTASPQIHKVTIVETNAV